LYPTLEYPVLEYQNRHRTGDARRDDDDARGC
jgi:hypothetical protein